jgi:hypothetical protein
MPASSESIETQNRHLFLKSSDHGGSRRKRMARFFPKCQRRLVNRSVASGAAVGSIAGKGRLPNKNDR